MELEPENAAPLRPLKIIEPQLVLEIASYLVRSETDPKKKLEVPSDELLPSIGTKLLTAMNRLLGPTIVAGHAACPLIKRHSRGDICVSCGYSDNLYAQELKRILRRLASAAKDAAAKEAKAKELLEEKASGETIAPAESDSK